MAVPEPPGARPIEKSVPVPVSPTDCGLPTALSLKIKDAVSALVVVGVKFRLTEQVLFVGTVAPLQVSALITKSPVLAPLTFTVLTVRGVPLFVTVTLIAGLFTLFC